MDAPRPESPSESEPPRAAGPASLKPAPELPPPPVGLRASVSEAAGVALVCALFGSIPAALRAAREGGSLIGSWLSTSAVVLPLLALTIGVSHTAGRGFRMVTGLSAGRSTAATMGLWLGLLAPVLMVAGSLLFEHTHHRGLGGATFGVVALVAAVGSALVARRLVATGRWLVARGTSERTVALALAALAIGPLLLLALPLLRDHDPGREARAVHAALIDGLIFSVSSAVAVSFDLGERLLREARRAGLWVAAGVMALGVFWLSLSPRLGVSIREGGGLAAALIAGLERWTDRDGDGYGAHFGGRDCDEGDPARHPGADDPVGDGIDQDCDGVDGVLAAPRAEEPPAPASEPAPPPVAAIAPAPRPASKPNIVLVLCDSLRFDRTSLGDAAAGEARRTTPNLRALAQRGTLFSQAYAPASDPQRATLPLFAAASWATAQKDRREWPTLKDENDTLAERMRAAGYRTELVSSFQWLSKERGFEQGFDKASRVFEDEHPERGVTGPLAVRAARAALEAQKADAAKPLFLVVQLFDAHDQWKRHEGLDFGKGKLGAYDSEVAFVDRQIGDLLATVKGAGLEASTAVVVAGLYGEAFEEHDASGHGKELYQEHVHVPLVTYTPGQSPAVVADVAVSTASLPATLLGLAGAEPPPSLPPALPLAGAGPSSEPKPVVLETAKRAGAVLYPLKVLRIERKGKERWLLFDLAADPGEKHDLTGERRDDFLRMKALLDQAVPAPKRAHDED